MKNCRKCGETSEDQFDACWNCGTDLDEGVTLTAKDIYLRHKDHRKKGNSNRSIRNVLSQSLREEINGLSKKPPTGVLSGRFLIGTLVILITLFILGMFHVVTGTRHVSGIDGITLIKRESFGYSEIYIDADAIVRMPRLIAAIRHPVGYRVVVSVLEKPDRIND